MKIKYCSTENAKINLNGVNTELSSNDLTENEIYDVISIENGWYRITDDSDDDYLYPPELFEITDDSGYEELKRRDETREWAKSNSEEKTA